MAESVGDIFQRGFQGMEQGLRFRFALEQADRQRELFKLQQQKAGHEELKSHIEQYKVFRDQFEGATGDLLLDRILTKFGMPEKERKAAIKDSRKNREAFDEYLDTIADEQGMTPDVLKGVFRNIPPEKRAEWILEKSGKRRERQLGQQLGQLTGFESRGGVSGPTIETEPGDVPLGDIFRPFSEEQRRGLRARQIELATQLKPEETIKSLFHPSQAEQIKAFQELMQGGQAGAPGGIEATGERMVMLPSLTGEGKIAMRTEMIRPGQEVEAFNAALMGLGIDPRTDPRKFTELRSKLILAQKAQGMRQDIKLEDVEKEISDYVRQKSTIIGKTEPFAPSGPAGAGLSAGAMQGVTGAAGGDIFARERALKAANESAITAARERAQALNARMSPDQERRFTSYNLIKQNISTIARSYEDGFVGGLPAAIGFQRALDKAVQEGLEAAEKEKYSGGSVVGKIKQYLGNLPARQVSLYRALADNADRILRARSGAQINREEAKSLLEIVPKANDMPIVFRAKFEDFIQSIHTEQMSMLEAITQAPETLRQRSEKYQAPKLPSKKSSADRYKELEGKGMPQDAIYRQMAREGY